MAKKIFLRDENNNKVLPITRGELVLDSSGNPAFHSNEFLATDSQPGLMSPVDKQKLETIAGNTIDAELSNTSTNPVQNKVLTQIINSIREKYLKSAVISGNKVTITDQSNNTIEFVNSTYQIVTNAVDGLVPKYDAVDGTIDTQTTDWVLTNHNGTLGWYRLPVAAFSSSSVQLFVGAKSTSNNNNSNSATTNGNTYLKLFDNSTLKNQYNIKGTGLTTVISDANGTITINVPTSHNQASSDINNLTGYAKATAISALAATDTLNAALGKLEYKADTTYELVKGAYDGDGTIENLAEILKVLEGIKDTDTIQAIVGKYLPLTGGTIYNSNAATPLYIKGATTSVYIGFQDKYTNNMGFIGMTGENSLKFCKSNGTTSYDILHTGNSGISNGTITINGTSITPLTQHQDLSNYVTLNTAQTITGEKTFATNILTISNPSNGDAALKFYRGGNTAWSIVDTGGNLKFNELASNTTRLVLYETSQGGSAVFAGDVVTGNDLQTKTINGGFIQRVIYNNNASGLNQTSAFWIKVANIAQWVNYNSTKVCFNIEALNGSDSPQTTSFSIIKSYNTTPCNYYTGLYITQHESSTYSTDLGFFNRVIVDSSYNVWLYYGKVCPGQTQRILITCSANFASINLLTPAQAKSTITTTAPTPVCTNADFSFDSIHTIVKSLHGNITARNITAIGGFYKKDSSNSYLLLGGGGHKAISDFLLKSEVANQELNNNLTTITKTLTVTSDWMDTGISSTNIPTTGTYIVQVSVHNTADNFWYCYWSGVMSWYASGTNDGDADTDEIILHRAGHACTNTIYLRTVMQSNSVLKLQIAANKTLSTAATYTFKFKRVI